MFAAFLTLLAVLPSVPTAPVTTPHAGTLGSSGADGPLIVAPGDMVEIDLATDGTFQRDEWLVRFDYTQVAIGDGATITFLNHPSRAPVAWFVLGDVTIGDGATIILDGQTGSATSAHAEPGPGGFRGGRGTLAGFLDNGSAGLGPGGALGDAVDLLYGGTGASHRVTGGLGEDATATAQAAIYGDVSLLQIVGGSGGGAGRRSSAGQSGSGGGAGGGALWIAADGPIDVSGSVSARGGTGGSAVDGGVAGGGGSGGAVRLSSLSGITLGPLAQLDVAGGVGGAGTGAQAGDAPAGGPGSAGRVRLESPNSVVTGPIPAAASVGAPDLSSLTDVPVLRVASIGGQAVPGNDVLNAGLGGAGDDPDIPFLDDAPVDVVIDTENLPAGSQVWLRVTRAKGPATSHGPELVTIAGGSVTFSSISVSRGVSAVQARAVLAQP